MHSILQQAGALLDAKAPTVATAFKGWPRLIAQHVAEAASKGDFLDSAASRGAEKATLAEISSALKLAP
jgi:hypothetical protein